MKQQRCAKLTQSTLRTRVSKCLSSQLKRLSIMKALTSCIESSSISKELRLRADKMTRVVSKLQGGLETMLSASQERLSELRRDQWGQQQT